MKIPKAIIKNNRKYTFVQVCSNNMFLYENEKTKAKETFTKYDLGLIDNTELDKKLKIANKVDFRIKVYDRLLEEEKTYKTIHEAAENLGITKNNLYDKIVQKKWINNRWFAEKEEVIISFEDF